MRAAEILRINYGDLIARARRGTLGKFLALVQQQLPSCADPTRQAERLPALTARMAVLQRKCRMSILQSSSGIVDVQQQRLNCALPSFL
jgi:hypothetical protein